MIIDSWLFWIFLGIFVLIYWKIPAQYRWVSILVFNLFMVIYLKVVLIALIVFFTTYVSSYLIVKGKNDRVKKTVMIIGVGLLLLELISGRILKESDIFRTLGLSFYALEAISYLVDLYHQKIQIEKHPGYLFVYLTFFPTVVSGPIERARQFLPQLKEKKYFNNKTFFYGINYVAWGIFLKFIIADSFKVYIDIVYSKLLQCSGLPLVLAAVFYSVQIYADFAGYSCIALGVSKMIGIDITNNFNKPYFAGSLREFWSCWHISLSSWLRDYVYIPLGGNRKGKVRSYFNLLVTFLVSGLWHGFNLTYLLWGFIHGIGQVVEKSLTSIMKPIEGRWFKFLRVCAVFLFCTIAWIPFSLNSLSEVGYYFTNMFVNIRNPIQYVMDGQVYLQMDKLHFAKLVMLIFILIIHDYKSRKTDIIDKIIKMPTWRRVTVYTAFVVIAIILLPCISTTKFIYYQF